MLLSGLCNLLWLQWLVSIERWSLRVSYTYNSQILRATHKISEHSVVRHDTKKLDPFLVLAAILTFVNCAMRINMYGSSSLSSLRRVLTLSSD
jgi:hypothetical protein